uniref:Predicted protein n=1 Tax=Physcomitrium patens TaxID=3218 RepID=A9U6E0_PHYPA
MTDSREHSDSAHLHVTTEILPVPMQETIKDFSEAEVAGHLFSRFQELNVAYDDVVMCITAKLAIMPKIGGTGLILTGVGLMIITKMGLSQMWLNVSILLALLIVGLIDGWIEPRMKKIRNTISERQDQIKKDRAHRGGSHAADDCRIGAHGR